MNMEGVIHFVIAYILLSVVIGLVGAFLTDYQDYHGISFFRRFITIAAVWPAVFGLYLITLVFP